MLLNSAAPPRIDGQFGELRRLWMHSVRSNDGLVSAPSLTSPEGVVTKRTKMPICNVRVKKNTSKSRRSEHLQEVATILEEDLANAPVPVRRHFKAVAWSAPNPVRRCFMEPSPKTPTALTFTDVPFGYSSNISRGHFSIYDPSILRHFLASRLEYTAGTILDGHNVPVFDTIQIACPRPPPIHSGEVAVAEHADDKMVKGLGSFGAVLKGKLLYGTSSMGLDSDIIAVKFFRVSDDLGFDKLYEDISRECRFYMVAERLDVSPQCYGILPGVEELGYARVAMVTEFFDGDNLWESFVEKRVVYSKKQVMTIVLKLSTAIRILHSYDICHNDINNNNVMVKKEKNGDVDLKLVDFGVSTVPGESVTYDVMEPGFTTKQWLAPEIRVGGWTSKASDIWSAGYCVEFIASVTKIRELKDIYEFCYVANPRKRPTAEEFEEFCALFVEDA